MTNNVTETRISIDGNLNIDGDIFFCPTGERGTITVSGSISARNIIIKVGWDIEAEGDIEAKGYIKAKGHIKAKGYIEAGWYIESEEYIKAGWYIKAKGHIEAKGYIESEEYLKAGWYIEAKGYIEAKEYIEAGWYIYNFCFAIKCKYLTTSILPYCRDYWARMLPLKQHAEIILNTKNCWDEIRYKLLPYAVEICAWEGWHPILAAQLQMFFKLKDRVEGECL